MAWNPANSDDAATRGPSAGELRRWTSEIVAVLIVLAIIVALGTGAAHSEEPTRQRAFGPVATVHRGRSSLDAAPSCWAIKQAFPSSRSGTYWLQTAQLVTPGRYYCDMTTGGGGWVLIGRGRDGWNFDWHGQGSASAVRTTIAGKLAFAPATLSSQTVIGLLAGQRVQTLADGIRLRRAANTLGTQWQEVRLRFNSMGQFTWNFDSGQPLRSVAFDTTSSVVGPSGHWYKQSTFDVRLDASRKLVHTGPLAEQHNITGFAYGRSVTGLKSSTTALWSATNGGPYALPFTQVWVRPKVTDANAGFTRVADTGLAAVTRPKLPTTIPQHVDWGVVDVQKPAEDPDPDGDSPVYGLVQIGSTMFVGGKFARVEHHSTHTTANQPWLAAFDLETGVWRSAFRPTLDGAVFDLAKTPDDKLIVAGNFTNVNGAPDTAGLAVLDPTTGAVVSGWRASVSSSRFGTARPYVRAVDVQGSWLYFVGSFNAVHGGPGATGATAGGLARVALGDGTPDAAFHGFFDRTPWDVDASSDEQRVYLAGHFTKYGATAAMASNVHGFTAVSTTDATVLEQLALPWFNSDVTDQLSTLEFGETVLHGGQSRWLARYDRDTLAFTRGTEMNPHGDVQVIAGLDGVVFAGCHCLGKSLADNKFGITRADAISWVGAWDPLTLDRYPSWVPQWKTALTSEGAWELTVDSRRCLWAGGDFVQGATSADWLGGFARFCPSDSTAPRKPTRFARSGMQLTWAQSVDNSGVRPTYEILRDDRVVATTTRLSYVATTRGRWFVRAVDRAGNRSISSSVIAF